MLKEPLLRRAHLAKVTSVSKNHLENFKRERRIDSFPEAYRFRL